jgi:hypothetical protein
VERSGRDDLVQVVIHKCMEATQELSLYNYPYLKLAKMPCFHCYLLCFFSNKIREQVGRSGSAWRLEAGHGEGGPNSVHTCK